ncbi:hypothetical protein Taro_002965 [Colocasia esculenta]|uniref:Uncharacterized protein n=1 Tax=Colocasia esculenta TaxID=4460 RepID=A0A843TE58_COLES|nr:hypothetical protein [Colocasia esculenta]
MDIWGYKYPCCLYPKGKRAHTLQEEAFWRPKGVFQICLNLQKLQAILSRGRTRESRGIPGEKLAVQGKGADPTEEAQEKKDFWHFRCHQSRASPIEENLHRFPSRFTHFCLGSVDTRSKQVDTSPRFQKTQLPEMGQQVITSSGQVDTLWLKVKIMNFSIHVAAWDLGDLT